MFSMENNQPKLYKFRPTTNLEWLADILIERRLFCCPVKDLNDPMEGILRANIKGEGMIHLSRETEERRVCALSANCDDIRLWAHYADSHKGIAIEFSPKNWDGIKMVKYENEIYTFKKDSHQINDELFVKLADWKYEEEYRYVTKNNEEYLYTLGVRYFLQNSCQASSFNLHSEPPFAPGFHRSDRRVHDRSTRPR